MMCKLFLFFALLLTVLEPLLGHPVVHPAEMSFTRPGKSLSHTLIQQPESHVSLSIYKMLHVHNSTTYYASKVVVIIGCLCI